MTAPALARLAGPAAFSLFLVLPPPQGLDLPGWYMLGVTLWMAIWWISEALPIAATALLSIALFPLLAALAEGLQVPPLLLMVTATLCASFAFMLPVATPPNAIVFGSRCVHMAQMARAGLWLNVVGVLLISLFVYLWGVLFPGAGLFSL